MISIKSPQEIKTMAEGGRILATVMKEISKKAVPGITTKELDGLAESLILKSGAKPSFKGYQNFPAATCISINDELVHAAPSERALKSGDIVSLDLGLVWQGFNLDMAVTLPVDKVSPEAQRLIRATKKALKRGIKKIRPGNTVGDIGNTIQRYVEGQGYNVVRDLCGHGIGRELHEDPQILNFGKRRSGAELAEGMVLCLEPMVTAGDWKLKKCADGFGYKTADGSLSAHFEHTVAVAENGPVVLTNSVLCDILTIVK
ncbi:MAG: Methionine aminopeptidase [Parcubacteria group bacterium GW2011_GWA2_47_9]|nr:MAG: Methionine aminopeptidase [Parcubacteria group bacterium GW2011_GWA2_47_9]